ncbi:MAG: acetyltransferase [Olsenella sp.]|nr:acetyltransferase [Olsenella sp.]
MENVGVGKSDVRRGSSGLEGSVAPTVRPARRRVAGLDGLRVIAILGIVLYHANPTWLPGGFFGVTVFLVVSGYLFTLSIQREVARTGSVAYGHLMFKRAARLWPTMLAVVGATIILTALFSPYLLPKVRSDAVPALLFFENIFYIVRKVSYFAAAGAPSPLTHFWYLGVLMQFYIVWPPVVLLLSRIVSSRRHACYAVCALILISSAVTWALFDPTADTARIYYGPDTRAAELLVGALLAIATGGRGIRLERLVPALRGRGVPAIVYDAIALLSLLGLIAMMFAFNGYSHFVYRGGMLVAAILTALLVGCISRPTHTLAGRALGVPLLAEAGKRGYALYLWHYPLLVTFNPASKTTPLPWWGWVLEFVAIFSLSELSYRFLEKAPERPLSPVPTFVGGRTPSGRRGVSHSRLTRGLLAQPLPRLVMEGVGVIAVLVLMLVPLNAETANAPQAMAAGQESALTQQAESLSSYDDSGTYFAGTAFDGAFSSINNVSYDVDAATGATDAKVILIGDSVPAGAINQFQTIFPNGYIDAAVGRQIYDGPDTYAQDVAEGHDGDIVVWSLGDNGVATEGQVKALVEAVDPGKRVYLVTARVPLALQDINNNLFKQVADNYPNCEVIDWYSASAGHDEYFWDDGTHLRPEGADAYVLMLRAAITGR